MIKEALEGSYQSSDSEIEDEESPQTQRCAFTFLSNSDQRNNYRSKYRADYVLNASEKWFVPEPYFAVWDGDDEKYAFIFDEYTGTRMVHTLLT